MKIINKKYLLSLALAIVVGLMAHLGYQDYQLGKEKLALENELLRTKLDFASTTHNLKASIRSLEQNLATTTAERNDFEQKYFNEQNRMNVFDTQIQGIQGTVSILEKLQNTDKELLMKYSKVYFLNENYVPKAFAKIDSAYTYHPDEDYFFYTEAWPFLQNLMADAKSGGIDINIISAYRSFGEQAQIKATHKMIYGSGANSFSADQGYSEHQLGTTVDFTTSAVGASFSGFEKTPAYFWLMTNAYQYGFILSYPENNQYYQFEPWHWRFVGKKLAGMLHEQGKYFYNLDQREINQYLVFLFDR